MNRIIIFALLVFCFSSFTAFGQSRTNRIYRPCPNNPLSTTPTVPGQLVINRDGTIDFELCFQKSLTISDPGSSIDIVSFNSLAGTFFYEAAYFEGGVDFQGGVTITGGAISYDRTITPGGTTGNVTINKPSGTVNIAAGAGTAGVTVTNSLVGVNSIVYAVARTNDATCSVKNVVAAAGSFVIRTDANCTAETSFGFLVTN